MSFEIYVGNYPSLFTREDLEKIFEEFPGISVQKFVKKNAKCFAFLSCLDFDQILSVIEKRNRSIVCGRELIVRAREKGLQDYIELILQERSNKPDSCNDFSPGYVHRRKQSLHLQTNNEQGVQQNRSFDKLHYSNIDEHDLSSISKGTEKIMLADTGNICRNVSESSFIPVKMRKNETCYKKTHDQQFHNSSPLNQSNAVEHTGIKMDVHPSSVANAELTKYVNVSDNKINISTLNVASCQLKMQGEIAGIPSLLSVEAINNRTADQKIYIDSHQFQGSSNNTLQSCHRDTKKHNPHLSSEFDKSPPKDTCTRSNKVSNTSAIVPLQVIKNRISDSKKYDKDFTSVFEDNQLPKSHDSFYQPSFSCASGHDSSIVRNSKASTHRLQDSLNNSFTQLNCSSAVKNCAPSINVSNEKTTMHLSWVSVTNFPLYMKAGDIRKLFIDYDPIHVRIICNMPEKYKTITEAHVSFSNSDISNDVIMNFDNTIFKGRVILVNDLEDSTIMEELLAVGQL